MSQVPVEVHVTTAHLAPKSVQQELEIQMSPEGDDLAAGVILDSDRGGVKVGKIVMPGVKLWTAT
jgi:hypothetical protein